MISGWLTHQSRKYKPQVCVLTESQQLCSYRCEGHEPGRDPSWSRCGPHLVHPGPSPVLGLGQLSGSMTALEHTGGAEGCPTRLAGGWLGSVARDHSCPTP